MPPADTYLLDLDTKVEFSEVELSKQQWKWLGNVTSGTTSSGSEPRHVDRLQLQTEKLAKIAFEYELLSQVANTTEIEVMRVFRERSETTLTTGEIASMLEKQTSSVSRALGRLVEKGQLEKVQQGVYRRRVN